MKNRAQFDRTYTAIKRQINAFGISEFEVGLFHRAQNKMLPRTWFVPELLKSVSWLKSMNHKGHDIFIRPKGSTGLVFFDDFSVKQLSKLDNHGFTPAVIIQSSPNNFHGWIKVSETPLHQDLATCICKVLASKFGGDIDSADWRHYGRLAGFTNQKPQYIDERGLKPFVLLHSSNGKLAHSHQKLVELGRLELDRRLQALTEKRQAIVLHHNSHELRDSCDFYLSELTGLYRRFGDELDNSRADWMIINKMIELGYDEPLIRGAMQQCSPALISRLGRTETYINVTIKNALSHFEN